MPSRYAAKLKELGFKLPRGCQKPSEKLVRAYEKRFALKLPEDYREFLVHHGGVSGSATCAYLEPTPCGNSSFITGFYGFGDEDGDGDVVECTEIIEGAPDVVALGDNLMGAMFWLKCTGRDAGHVYMHDHQGRSAWTDKQFYEWFPDLSPEIQQYLTMRKQKKLPKKPKGYAHVYCLAKTFDEFMERLEKSDE